MTWSVPRWVHAMKRLDSVPALKVSVLAMVRPQRPAIEAIVPL